MIFYVIGNGFDLHYGLDTSYYSFKKYLMTVNYEVVERVDDLFDRYDIGFENKDIDEWSNFEDMLAVFCQLDRDELYEEAFDNAEMDDERAGYFDSPSWNVGYYTEYIDILKNEFTNWINKIDSNINQDIYFAPNKDDYILTFNYTETIEANFSVKESNILHIHGKVGENLIVGHNEYDVPYLYDIKWDEDSDYRDVSTREAVNNVLERSANLYYKDSEAIIEYYLPFFDYIKQCDKVVFLGLSCGNQDIMYVEEIVKRAKKIDFYWYKSSDADRFRSICEGVNPEVQINFIEW